MKHTKLELRKLINASTPNFKLGDIVALMDSHSSLEVYRLAFINNSIVILVPKNKNITNIVKIAKIIAPLLT